MQAESIMSKFYQIGSFENQFKDEFEVIKITYSTEIKVSDFAIYVTTDWGDYYRSSKFFFNIGGAPRTTKEKALLEIAKYHRAVNNNVYLPASTYMDRNDVICDFMREVAAGVEFPIWQEVLRIHNDEAYTLMGEELFG